MIQGCVIKEDYDLAYKTSVGVLEKFRDAENRL